jgi:hypothetical protein
MLAVDEYDPGGGGMGDLRCQHDEDNLEEEEDEEGEVELPRGWTGRRLKQSLRAMSGYFR